MVRLLDAELFGPIIVTAGLWWAVIFLIAAFVSRLWANMAGLMFAFVAPVIYKFAKGYFPKPSRVPTDDSAMRDSVHAESK